MTKSAIRTWSLILLFIAITVTFLMRSHITLYRYFDTDEWAHLHWAYHLFIGRIPYRDFFIYHIPLFQIFLLPLFLLPQSPEAIIFSRIAMTGIFLLCMGILSHITWKITKSSVSVLFAVLVMIISPIMIDKGLEVRPDMLMLFFFLCTFWLLLFASHTPRYLFLAGISLGLSILTFQKMIFALPALAVLFLYTPVRQAVMTKKIPSIPVKAWSSFIAAGCLVFFAFLLYLTLHGALFQGLDAMFRTTKDIYAYQIIKFSPFLALTPWQFVYVGYEGPSLPWAVNTFLLLSMIGGTILLAVNKKWKLFLFFTLFFTSAVLYLILFPTPYVQYYVPVMMIGSIVSAYFFHTAYTLLPAYPRIVFVFILSCTALFSFYEQYKGRILPQQSSSEQMQVIRDVAAHIKPEETVYDMAGSYVYRPSGYILCCHRYADFFSVIRPEPLSLTESLINNKTKFIVLDRNGYAFWLVPEPHKTFIRTNYLESAYKKIYSLGYRYSCSNGTCRRINYEGGAIEADPSLLPIVIEETYKLKTTPSGLSVNINGKTMNDGQSQLFTPDTYSIEIPPSVSEAVIQLDR